MKHRTLPVKRTPASTGIFKRLSAVTRNRKQRVAATASEEAESDDHSSKISRALTIIFLIHIVVIGLIFFHQKFLDTGSTGTEAVAQKPAAPAAREYDLPMLSSGDAIYRVRAGDNYPLIAADHGIDEAELRAANDNKDIQAGAVMKIPPKKIVAVAPELAAFRAQATPPADMGLVEAVPVGSAPRAVVVRPNPSVASEPVVAPVAVRETPAPAASGSRYVVQSGDNIWRIANRFKVDQKALMKANGISDPKKLKLGMSLVIPR